VQYGHHPGRVIQRLDTGTLAVKEKEDDALIMAMLAQVHKDLFAKFVKSAAHIDRLFEYPVLEPFREYDNIVHPLSDFK